MRSSRGAVGAAMLAAALALSACTGSSGSKTITSATTAATAPPVTSSLTTSPSGNPRATKPKPTPIKTVPVDQIPPGNPASWVPAGVPTTARYKEPGDVVPKFTQAMFKNNYNGALAVMAYYFDAVNWDIATGATPTIYKSFCPTACDQEIKHSIERKTKREHYHRGRYTPGSPAVIPAPRSHHATWSGQFNVVVASGEILGPTGNKVIAFNRSTVGLVLDVKFSGRLWNVVGIYFAR